VPEGGHADDLVGRARHYPMSPAIQEKIGSDAIVIIAASLAFPDAMWSWPPVTARSGSTQIEVDTAVRHKAPVVEVHDQTGTHGKVVGTRLQFSDHAAMARAFGMHGERVERAEDLEPALERAFANRPALIDVVVTPEAVSSDGKTGLAWVPDLQALAAWDDAERKWRSGQA
jgi:acetolactate synthase-1/2/3 large subunit